MGEELANWLEDQFKDGAKVVHKRDEVEMKSLQDKIIAVKTKGRCEGCYLINLCTRKMVQTWIQVIDGVKYDCHDGYVYKLRKEK